MRVYVVFDTRERSYDAAAVVAEVARAYQLDIAPPAEHKTVAQLPVADILFLDATTDRCLMMVEHKTMPDFLASLQPAHLQSKRLTDQLDRMKTSGVPHLALLLSGNPTSLPAHVQKALVTKTTRMQLQIPPMKVFSVPSLDDLPTFIGRAVEGLTRTSWGLSLPAAAAAAASDDAPADPQTPLLVPGPTFEELTVAVRKSQTDTPAKLWATVLQLVPRFSAKTAATIVAKYPTQVTLADALRLHGVGALTKLKCGKRCIDRNSAELLRCFLLGLDHVPRQTRAARGAAGAGARHRAQRKVDGDNTPSAATSSKRRKLTRSSATAAMIQRGEGEGGEEEEETGDSLDGFIVTDDEDDDEDDTAAAKPPLAAFQPIPLSSSSSSNRPAWFCAAMAASQKLPAASSG